MQPAFHVHHGTFQAALQAREAQAEQEAARLSEAAHARQLASLHTLASLPDGVTGRCVTCGSCVILASGSKLVHVQVLHCVV